MQENHCHENVAVISSYRKLIYNAPSDITHIHHTHTRTNAHSYIHSIILTIVNAVSILHRIRTRVSIIIIESMQLQHLLIYIILLCLAK